jgi:hypothetical protein
MLGSQSGRPRPFCSDVIGTRQLEWFERTVFKLRKFAKRIRTGEPIAYGDLSSVQEADFSEFFSLAGSFAVVLFGASAAAGPINDGFLTR